MKNQRAYSLLMIKAVDDEARTITGIATTPAPDRYQDVVEPKGAQFKLPIPFLWQHNSAQPIGHVVKAKVTATGIEVTVQLAKVDEPGTLRDRLEEAWQSIKAGLVQGLSIGFSPIEYNYIEGTGGVRFLKWDWLELSAVTIPANAECSIQTVKSADRSLLAASGHREHAVVRLDNQPGASGDSSAATTVVRATPAKPKEKDMNIQEQIKAFKATRQKKADRMAEIMKAATERGETLNAEEKEEYDGLKVEIKEVDEHLERLVEHEKAIVANATVITPPATLATDPTAAQRQASQARGGQAIQIERKLPPGVGFARYAGCLAASKGSVSDAVRLAKQRFPEDNRLHALIENHDQIRVALQQKSAVDIGIVTDSDYASPLVYAQNLTTEFIDYLRPQTIVGRIPGLRRVPFNVRVPRQTSGGSASWVGEAKPKPLTQFALDYVELKNKKLATIAVISEELARFSSPSAELIVRDTLAGAVVQQMDSDFVNPSNSGTSNVKPASITNGASTVVSSGDTEEKVRRDVRALFALWIAANMNPADGVWIMSATNALGLSLMVNSLGQPSFPGVSMNGGVFMGLPVIVSETAGTNVILANAGDILVADDGAVTIDVSREASVQMDSAPDDPATASTVMISLWQQNLLGIRCERHIDWVKGRSTAVVYLTGVEWGYEST
jgi:HK97 family phage major capsid protein/HK97 family phage prohead protease